MNIESIQCNHCGAPLELPESAKFATCRHCGSQLAVHRTASAVTTEVLQRVATQVEEMADEVRKLRLETSLSRMDREWEKRREGYLVHSKNGKPHEPSEVGGVIAMVFGVVFAAFGIGMGGPGILVGLLGCGVTIVMGVLQINSAQQFRAAKRRHELARLAAIRAANDQDDEGQSGGDAAPPGRSDQSEEA
ncbi:MAG: hypothetical protein U0939_00950 [Pirellulales bacterium]